MKPRASCCPDESRDPSTRSRTAETVPRPPPGQGLTVSFVSAVLFFVGVEAISGSGYLELGDEDLALGLGAEKQGDDDADRGCDSSDQHRDDQPGIKGFGTQGQHPWHESAPDRSLVVAKGARGGAH